jgi:hypothetical protein
MAAQRGYLFRNKLAGWIVKEIPKEYVFVSVPGFWIIAITKKIIVHFLIPCLPLLSICLPRHSPCLLLLGPCLPLKSLSASPQSLSTEHL